MRILFADDSRASALPIIAYLEKQGHHVSYAPDGGAAVEAYQQVRPDLVLMDVVMPVMDGIAATRRIKAMGGDRWVPVMLMTSLSAKEEIVAGLDAGADDYLIKPINIEVLEARMRSMQRIATIQDSLFGILDNVFEAVITINEAGIILNYNKAAERIFGHTADEAIGRNVKLLMPSPHGEQHDGYLARYLREGTPKVIGIGRKVRGLRKNGDTFPMRLAVTEVIQTRGRQFIGLVSDISYEEAARERIEFLALHDPLTALPNRAQFNDRLEKLLVAPARPHALLFIDLDGFKPINDTMGHEAGDEALRITARRLRHEIAQDDFVARLGGDEFVVIAGNVAAAADARAIAERLRAAIAAPLLIAGTACQMGASIGVALLPRHGRTPTEILTAADNAMYAAKRAGKNCVVMAQEPS